MACTKVAVAAALPECIKQQQPMPGASPTGHADPVQAISACLDHGSDAIEWLVPCLRALSSFDAECIETSSTARSVVVALLEADLPVKVFSVLDTLDFETQKCVVRLFDIALCRAQALDAMDEVEAYARRQPDFTRLLMQGCAWQEIALHTSLMLRACARHPALVSVLLEEGASRRLAELAAQPSLETAFDAFGSLRALLLVQKTVASSYILRNFDDFFDDLHNLLNKGYVPQRQALQLLGELLLDRAFTPVLLWYVGTEAFLKLHMRMLLDQSRSVRVGAFDIFELFVANPKRPLRIRQILFRNKDRLLTHLHTSLLHSDETPRKTFASDLQKISSILSSLECRAST